MNKEQFIKEVEKLGIFLTEEQLDQLDRFYHLLIEWNKKINLTRIIEENEVYAKHFYDSLTLIKAVDLRKNVTLLDVGSGAGFPGIVLKIVFPNLKITLVDSLLKRIKYLNIVIETLQLKNIEAIHTRIEDYAKKKIQFDIVTSRAVANMTKLYNYCIPVVKNGGYFIAMKANAEDELSEFLKKYDVNIKEIKFMLPYENAHRDLVVIKK